MAVIRHSRQGQRGTVQALGAGRRLKTESYKYRENRSQEIKSTQEGYQLCPGCGRYLKDITRKHRSDHKNMTPCLYYKENNA